MRKLMLFITMLMMMTQADAVSMSGLSVEGSQGYFTLSSLGDEDVSIYSIFPMPISFNVSNLHLNASSQAIAFSVSNNASGISSGNYNGTFVIVGNNTILQPATINILPLAAFDISLSQYNVNITDLRKNRMEYTVHNSGNVKVRPAFNGTCIFVSTFVADVQPFDSQTFPLFYDVPDNQTSIKCAMNFTAQSVSIQKNLSFEIIDTIKPVINEIKLGSERAEANSQVRLVINASDNSGNLSVSVEARGSYAVENIPLKYASGLYLADIKLPIPDTYVISVQANDSSGNTVSQSKRLTIDPISSNIQEFGSVNYYIKLFGTPVRKKLLTFADTYQINVSLSEIRLANLTPVNFSAKIVTSKENHELIQGEKRYLSPFAGDLELELFSDGQTSFSGKISIEKPRQLNLSDTIEFSGQFANYSLPEPRSFDFLAVKANCEAKTDISQYVCTIGYPLSVNFTEIVIPMTQAQWDQTIEQFRSNQENERKKREGAEFWMWVLFAMMLLAILAYSYKDRIYPVLRLRLV